MRIAKKHVNIPIFIPHLGCPNQCVFCNQRSISGVEEFDPSTVNTTISEALETISPGTDVEIAFFGGSFTGIDRDLMIKLLGIANTYILDGSVKSIRCSTRPDYIDDEVIDLLKLYGVDTVELGLQSISENVLCASRRGHTFDDCKRACTKLVDAGINLVGQMMIGLPCSTLEDEIDTAKFIIDMGASAARIYPTVVFYDTELSEMYKSGIYSPLTIDEAVERSAAVLELFLDAGVDVIRIGLCSGEGLSDASKYHSGPNHPALGELVESRIFYNRIVNMVKNMHIPPDKVMVVTVAKGAISKAIGQKRINKARLIKELGLTDIIFRESDFLSDYELTID